jgi:hypothetical protein
VGLARQGISARHVDRERIGAAGALGPPEVVHDGVLAPVLDLLVEDDRVAEQGEAPDTQRFLARGLEGRVVVAGRFRADERLDEVEVRRPFEPELAAHGVQRTLDALAAEPDQQELNRPQPRAEQAVPKREDDEASPPAGGGEAERRSVTGHRRLGRRTGVGWRRIGSAADDDAKCCRHGGLPGSGGESRRQDVPPGNS